MLSSGIKAVVSEYELLNSNYNAKRQSLEDDHFFPLYLRQERNSNSDILKSRQLDHIQAESKIPVPTEWSPGMIPCSNHLLCVTPEKPQKDLADLKENILEPQDTNTIPQPAVWSPGMSFRPNPSLFVTPDQQARRNISSRNSVDNDENMNVAENEKEKQLKSKEKLNVRFDLPSLSSGDETTEDIDLDCASPITGLDSSSCPSPVWKTFQHKFYNPNYYSDDSVLEKSLDQPIANLTTLQSSLVNQTSKSNKPTAPGIAQPTDPASPGSQQIKGLLVNGPVVSRKNMPGKQKCQTGAVQQALQEKPPALTQPSVLELPPVSVVRESKSNFISTEYSFPFSASPTGGEYEHIFARPEFNSTLKLRSELDSLFQGQLDLKKAVEVTLAKSEVKRSELNEKAANYTNRACKQFQNLVDIDTSLETLCDRVVRMRTSKAHSQRLLNLNNNKSSNAATVPDLMEFFSSDLQKETPSLKLLGTTTDTSKLHTSSATSVFDLYRHNRVWLGIHDF
ncbi:uncharacterized protein LOC131943992 isoform X2 [Physella acuta]|nr:uncharacterized protein LOC131943992 isoform X2 [Physella acuta]XP_059160403.1 uncharacterized protein LOC131943992 isoform X2 [Physella acuta]